MADADRTLEVWCFGQRAGTLRDARRAGVAFDYDLGWLADGRPPLSQSLPLDDPVTPAAAASFFGGLLPEGAPRERPARRLGISAGNDFSLLAALGGDTAGAISLQPPDRVPQRSAGEITWLDDGALAVVLDELPSRPMHADDDGEYRLSLAGAQDKLPVVVDANGRIGLTRGQTPSTHIIKTPIARLPDTVANEAFCLAVGRALGVGTVSATPQRSVGGREFLLIERYDRRADGETTARLHQEDFCQALGVPPARKHQAEGGPSLADCFGLLRGAAAQPARAVVAFLDSIAVSFLVGNHDAHGKNFSLLYWPQSRAATLAPAYDLISTVAYAKAHNLTRKMAMSIGGEYRPDYLAPRHVDRLLADAGLGVAAARRRLRAHADAAPSAAREVCARFAADGWQAPILDTIINVIDRRAARLRALATPSRSRTSRP